MKGNRKKLNECFLWVVLFIVCAIFSVFYMVKEPKGKLEHIDASTEMTTEVTTEATTLEEVSTIEEPETERVEQLIEDIPSGTI